MRALIVGLGLATLAACASSDLGPRIAGTNFATLDLDANGIITATEFGEQEVSFAAIDKNGNGQITAEEVAAFNRVNSASTRRDRSRSTGSRL
ncbi:MAG: EF-hand domain-containing protein [Parvularculaceae bacterium]|nr:EF-hand domain-containing protein [Parvularculaceae bacterium]